jgi:hypothetical protein
MQKKDSTKKKPAAKSTPEEDSSSTLAYHVSAVLKHPRTPSILYNAMTDVLTDMLDLLDGDAPDMIERSLEAYEVRETKRRGGE